MKQILKWLNHIETESSFTACVPSQLEKHRDSQYSLGETRSIMPINLFPLMFGLEVNFKQYETIK